MMNKLIETINNIKTMMNDYNGECFVIIRNPETKINHWKTMGYDVTYDYVIFDSIDNMNNFINGVATYDYIDNSAKLHDGEMVLYHYMNGVNRYIDLKNIIVAVYDDFFIENEFMYFDEFTRYDVNPVLMDLHDKLIGFVFDFLAQYNPNALSMNMIDKFTGFVHKMHDKTKSRYYREKYGENNDTSLSIEYINPYGETISRKHIGNFSNDICKSYSKRFFKLNRNEWDDMTQSGLYCAITNRNYCTNHEHFEKTYNVEWINYNI